MLHERDCTEIRECQFPPGNTVYLNTTNWRILTKGECEVEHAGIM